MEFNANFDFIKNPLNRKELAERYNLIVAQEQSSKWQKIYRGGQYDLYILTLSFSPHRFKNQDKAVKLLHQRVKEFYAEILENGIIKSEISKEPQIKPRLSLFQGAPLFSPNEEFLYSYHTYKRVYLQGPFALAKGVISGEELIVPFNGRLYHDIDSQLNLCRVDITNITESMPSPTDYIRKKCTGIKGTCNLPINLPE